MLKCVSPYRSGLGVFQPGETVDDPVLEAALLNDSPGSFEVVAEDAPEAEVRAVEAPPADRMVRRANKRLDGVRGVG